MYRITLIGRSDQGGAANKSALGVLVERTTRLVLLAKPPDATAESALAAFTFKLNQIAEPMRQTLTYDQGREMVRPRELARATNMRVYFCDLHSPWQRGTCENTNGLLRQMLPKWLRPQSIDLFNMAGCCISDLRPPRVRCATHCRLHPRAIAIVMQLSSSDLAWSDTRALRARFRKMRISVVRRD